VQLSRDKWVISAGKTVTPRIHPEKGRKFLSAKFFHFIGWEGGDNEEK
jgi:hypothetical protein